LVTIIKSFIHILIREEFFFRHETPWKQKEDPLEVATMMVSKLEQKLNSVNQQTKRQEQSHWKQLVIINIHYFLFYLLNKVELMTQERRARRRQAELEAKIVIDDIINSVFEHEEAVMQADMLSINDRGWF
jgi:predicted secreted Zn-dependent protease